MKRLFLISIVILIFLSFELSVLSFEPGEIPAPFAKAKEMLIKNNFKSIQFGGVIKGDNVIFFIGYLKENQIIGIGIFSRKEILVAEYCEKSGKFSIYKGSQFETVRKIEAQGAVTDLAFKIFWKIVEGKFI